MQLLRKIYYQLPPSLRLTARKMVFFPIDVINQFTGKADANYPPQRMIFTGSGDFKKQGEKFLQLFIKHGALEPQHNILDVGSGIGRIAIPLASFLNEEANYEGFDAMESGIKWCKKNISNKHPNFNFRHIPIKNDLYRNNGKDAAHLLFPYADNFFDFIPVISVFTHLSPDEMNNYLSQIFKKLKPGGICFATFFIWNHEVEKIQPTQNFTFPFDFGHYKIMDKKVQRANVAFKESYLQVKIEQTGFKLKEKYYGHWSGRAEEHSLDFQDILILQKP